MNTSVSEEVGHGHVTYVRRRIYEEVYYTELCSLLPLRVS